ncbi:MAG: hypothetical protein U0519_04475 [Candidatus Gracilibacteria bacterium]
MKKQQQTFIFSIRDLVFWGVCLAFAAGLFYGFGYFLGRYDQIQLSRSSIRAIPDVNCSPEALGPGLATTVACFGVPGVIIVASGLLQCTGSLCSFFTS